MSPDTRLPRDAQSILELAARSMFDLFANASEGMLLVDRAGRVVWINDQYRRFLPALGFQREEDFVGHPVSSVVQNTQMHQVLETGKPILIDLLTNRAGTFVVSRIPLREEDGRDHRRASASCCSTSPRPRCKPLHREVRAAAARPGRRPARAGQPAQPRAAAGRGRCGGQRAAPRQVHLRQLHRQPAPAALEVKRHARRAAQSSSPVLLLGETGTGKELLAHAIHAGLARARAGPFVEPEHRGRARHACWRPSSSASRPAPTPAPTGSGRDGKFKLADGGTLFLDEIGDMPMPRCRPSCCGRCRRARSSRWARTGWCRFDARVIAATSRDLAGSWCARASFREDLYYRLNVLPLKRAAAARTPVATSRLLVESAQRRPGPAQRRQRATRSSCRDALDAAGRASTGAATSASCATCWSSWRMRSDSPAGRTQPRLRRVLRRNRAWTEIERRRATALRPTSPGQAAPEVDLRPLAGAGCRTGSAVPSRRRMARNRGQQAGGCASCWAFRAPACTTA